MPQTVTPYLLYEDAAGALEWLTKAFGFRETTRVADESGDVQHAEMDVGDGSPIYLGDPGGDYRNPSKVGRTCSVYVYVANVDDHCAQARAAGAEIIEEPADQEYGDRRYGARDLEGHDWFFAHPIAVEAREEPAAATA